MARITRSSSSKNPERHHVASDTEHAVKEQEPRPGKRPAPDDGGDGDGPPAKKRTPLPTLETRRPYPGQDVERDRLKLLHIKKMEDARLRKLRSKKNEYDPDKDTEAQGTDGIKSKKTPAASSESKPRRKPPVEVFAPPKPRTRDPTRRSERLHASTEQSKKDSGQVHFEELEGRPSPPLYDKMNGKDQTGIAQED